MVMHGSTKYTPKHIKEQRELLAVNAPPPLVQKPTAPKIRAEVEPPTSNLTLYGESAPPACPSAADPQSYKPRDWCSVTKSQYKSLPHVAISKEIQNERARFQMSSDLPLNEESIHVFNPAVGFAGKQTQFKTDFKPLEREWYVNRPATYAIGSHGASGVQIDAAPKPLGAKGGSAAVGASAVNANANPFSGHTTHSDVHIKETEQMEPHLYETLTKRQYQPYPIDKDLNRIDKARRWENKKDMVASHFMIGTDKTQYDTAAKVHLPSEKPLVKNHQITTAPTNNPFVARTVADARPAGLSVKEVAHRKAASSVPVLTKNNPEYYQYGGQWPSTTTQYATPSWCPERQPGWQLFGNGLGGVRLGHEEKYEAMPDGTYSPKRMTDSRLDGEGAPSVSRGGSASVSRSAILNPVTGLPIPPSQRDQSNATPTPNFGRRSNNTSALGNYNNTSNGMNNTVTSNSTARGANSTVDPRWVSATKSSFKGFQYQ